MSFYETILDAAKTAIEGVTSVPVYVQNWVAEERLSLPCVVLAIQDTAEQEIAKTFAHDIVLYKFFLYTFARRSAKDQIDYDLLQLRQDVNSALDSLTDLCPDVFDVDVAELQITDNPDATRTVYVKETDAITPHRPTKIKYQFLQGAALVSCKVADLR